MTAHLIEPVSPGERCVVVSWPVGRDGRKLEAGCAIYDSSGRPLAAARALWIKDLSR